MDNYHKEIEHIESLFEDFNLEELRKVLPPLLEKNIPAAIRINASFGEAGMPDEEVDRLYVEGMFKAAKLGDLKAKYIVGMFYDIGDYGIQRDQKKASHIFKELSEKGDPHCMWIYACELIWGRGTFPKSTDEGISLLYKASESGSANACMTIAEFYNNGELNHPKDIGQRDKYRKLALKYDDTTFDPYA